MRELKQRRFLFFLALAALLALLITLFSFKSLSPRTDNALLACKVGDLSGKFLDNELVAVYEGKEIPVGVAYQPSAFEEGSVLSLASASERWIEVDLSEQRLKAWEGDELFLETPVSTGLPWWPTPEGEFRIWMKLRYTKMEGGEGKNYYYLPNVPFVMFFQNDKIPGWRGYGLHGTYWHSDFGRVRSHGCVNLPTSAAEKLFNWTWPVAPEGKWAYRATSTNPGTRIVIHD